MKKLCCILAALMAIACMCFNVGASSDLTFSIPDVSVLSNSQFSLPVSISNNDGICGIDIVIGYDSAFEFVSASSEYDFDDMLEYSVEKGRVHIACHRALSKGDCAVDGELIVLLFSAPATISEGEYAFNIIRAETTDYNENVLTPATSSGSVYVMNPITFSGSEHTEAGIGDVIEYTVSASNNVGFATLVLDVSFDSSKLEYVPYGDDTSSAVVGLPDGAIYMFNEALTGSVRFGIISDSNIGVNGAFVKFRFKVLSELDSETVRISVSEVVNEDGLTLKYTSVDGHISSSAEGEEYILGDADGSGSITAGDAALVLQAAAGMISVEKSTIEFATIDVDFSGSITAGDAAIVLQGAAGMLGEDSLVGTKLVFSGK